MYEPQLREQISQGDIFRDVPIFYFPVDGDNQPLPPLMEPHLAIMLTHDCEFDKPKNIYAIVAQIIPFSEIAAGLRGDIRKGRARNGFYLEASEGFEEGFVDLRRIDRTGKTTMIARDNEGKRILSLTEDARKSLQYAIARYFGIDR